MKETNFHIVGGDPDDVQEIFEILELVAGPYCVYYGCSATEAELMKYMTNSFLALKVSYVNEFYEIVSHFNADWHKVREGWLLDERIGRGSSSVFPKERGFGGKCLPKDINAIIHASERAGYVPELLKSVVSFNDKITTRSKT